MDDERKRNNTAMNETYRYAKMKITEAEQGKKSSCSVFIRAPDCGKTETAMIIVRDFRAIFLDRASETEQKEFFQNFAKSGINTIVLDDPSNWMNANDFKSAISILKNLISGELQMGRATVFDINLPFNINHKICVLLFCTPDQWTVIRKILKVIGLYDRSKIFYCDHDTNTKNYIAAEYEKHGYSKSNLPRFKLNGTSEFSQKFLDSATGKRAFMEQIEFEEVKDVKT